MPKNGSEIQSVKTNIITGFLGVGKTSAILHLLKNKPEQSRWAVLINEFGEIGVDGHLVQGNHTTESGVFIREVPGGCMCCAAGLPMQIALNQLLSRANPDRLLIEPTGLGHPIEVMQVLNAEHYKNVLSMQKTITMVDARKLADKRYTDHATFKQQIAIADLVVGNKTDLYNGNEKDQLIKYAQDINNTDAEVVFTEQAKLDNDWLIGESQFSVKDLSHHHSHTAHPNEDLDLSTPAIPDCGYLKAENHGEGFKSIGWRFSPSKQFNYSKLYVFLSGVDSERLKGVFITENGIFAYNFSDDSLSEIELDETDESRIEIIALDTQPEWEQQLLSCLIEDN